MNINQQEVLSDFLRLHNFPEPNIKPEQQVVFFNTKLEPLPAIVQATHRTPYGIVADLLVYMPEYNKEVKLNNGNPEINEHYWLKEELRLKVNLTYPEVEYRSQSVKLDIANVNSEVNQTLTDVWIPSAVYPFPKLYEVATSQIGKFFDPRFYDFRIFCHKGEYEDVFNNKIPEETAYFPVRKPLTQVIESSSGFFNLLKRKAPQSSNPDPLALYSNYFDCYTEFFHQRYEEKDANGADRWDRIEIQAVYKENKRMITEFGAMAESKSAEEIINDLDPNSNVLKLDMKV